MDGFLSIIVIAVLSISFQAQAVSEDIFMFNVYGKNTKRFLQKTSSNVNFSIVQSQGNWQLVKFNDQVVTAWVSERYISVNGNQVVVLGNFLNARHQPRLQASIITQLEKGYQSRLLGREAGFVQLYLPSNTIFAVKSTDIANITAQKSRWQVNEPATSSVSNNSIDADLSKPNLAEAAYTTKEANTQAKKITPSRTQESFIERQLDKPAIIDKQSNEQVEAGTILAANNSGNSSEKIVIGGFYDNAAISDKSSSDQSKAREQSQVKTPLEKKTHRISPGDTISLQVFGEPDMSLSSVRVPESGDVSFPLIGTVKVAGSTTKELEQHIASLLSQGYIRNPKLSVTIDEYRPIFIKGAVSVTGSFPYSERLTVSKALALAGGVSESADRQGIMISRDGTTIASGLSVDSEYIIESGDVISVREEAYVADGSSQYVYLHGEVKNPGAFEYRKGLTIEKAIVLAGGFSLRASKRRISVTRAIDDQPEPKKMKKVKLYMPVLPGDIIDVGASWF